MGRMGQMGLMGEGKRGWFPPLYAFDTPSLYAQHHSSRQRPKSRIDLETLRRLASTYDPMRACIQHLKAEVAAVPGKIVVRDPLDQSSTARINQASEWFFSRHGGLGGFGRRRRHFEDEIFEDALVLGQFAVHVEETRGGMPYEVNAIDAATIRPKVNSFGWIDPADAYEQQVMGVVVRPSLSMSELIVDGLNAVSYQPYFVSPVEWLIGVALSALKADEWNRTWLTDGNVPDQLIAVPKDWTPDQMQAYAGYFDALLSGSSDLAQRRKAKIVPDGTKPVWSQSRKDSDFQAFELWLLRRTCSIFGVQPTSIGYAGEQYKVSQEGSLRQTTQFGVGRLLELRKDLYDELLDRLGYPELEWRNVVEGEEDPLERARRLQIAVGGPWMTVAEARQEEGLSGESPRPVDHGEQRGFSALAVSDEVVVDIGALRAALDGWMEKAVGRLAEGKKAVCSVESVWLDPDTRDEILDGLEVCHTESAVRDLFREFDPAWPRNREGRWVEVPIESHPLFRPCHEHDGIRPSHYGAFGPAYSEFKGRSRRAQAFLASVRAGVALNALHHVEIGYIDLPWGDMHFGLEMISRECPEVIEHLRRNLAAMTVVGRMPTKIELKSASFAASVDKVCYEGRYRYVLASIRSN